MSTGSFSAPSQVHTFDGLLSDFDGTIVDSTEAIVKHWHLIGEELGVDPKTILATSHGRRSIDTMQLYDKTKANWEYVNYIEGRIPQQFGSDAVEIPGGRALLAALENAGARWGVVTSGTSALIDGWLGVLKLARPSVLVVAEDVDNGKPDPSCYLLGRKKLGLEDSTSIVVLEDAPSGIKAGKAAGFKVIALKTTHSLEKLQEAGADWIVEDLRSVSVKEVVDGRVQIEIKNAYQ
ncbi:Glycerol-3-phosphate phosphatase [Penicillium chermesinum]|uniref:Glycerol-3-phosphate phosphatase n=1 Tax=Penicillium chermesinum TaxID=63820 RepID=A0A9W9TYZ7_9EURO|nr:Glycerol-3-phosphate phosphatase [Penicillium chermesinum]KAJ5246819.1 Glycerol-3-phosphate phosphatase [Penicillium chermesinum]KAJ6145078.1 Glycerol-3-phosphate phosphatase [Penicillium chermesinum]